MNKAVAHTLENDHGWEYYDPDNNPIPHDCKFFSFILEKDINLPDGDEDEKNHLTKLDGPFSSLVNSKYDKHNPYANILRFKVYK